MTSEREKSLGLGKKLILTTISIAMGYVFYCLIHNSGDVVLSLSSGGLSIITSLFLFSFRPLVEWLFISGAIYLVVMRMKADKSKKIFEILSGFAILFIPGLLAFFALYFFSTSLLVLIR